MPSPIGPAIPPEMLTAQEEEEEEFPEKEEEEEDEDDYAPALPPDILASRSGNLANSTATKKLGPSLPPPSYSVDIGSLIGSGYADGGEDSDDEVGPMPLPPGAAFEATDGVREFMEKEERRRKKIEEAAKPKPLKRDEWMLVPPTSSDLLGTLDPTKLKPRQFARTQAPSKHVDSSLWTETPAERQQRIADEVSGKKRRAANADDDGVTPEEALELRKRLKKDEAIRRGVEEHTRKVRGSALVDVHTKAVSGSSSAKDEPHAIWDHGRDMSLGGRLMDDKTRNRLVNDAKGLGDRFGTGKGGGFL